MSAPTMESASAKAGGAMTSLLFAGRSASDFESLQRQMAYDERWDLRWAPDADAAMAALAQRPADVVFAALRMPVTDGAEFLRRVQTASPSTIRVMLARTDDDDAPRRALPVAHQLFTDRMDATTLLRMLSSLDDLCGLIRDPAMRELVGGVSALPPRPRVYFALTEALLHPEVSMAKVTEIIEHDPVIAGRVLHLANSAFFGMGSHISELGGAIAHIGYRTLHSLVAACEVFGALSRQSGDTDGIDAHVCARLARQIGRERGNEDAFTATLLRDLGVLVVRYSATAPQPQGPLPSGRSQVSTPADCAAVGFDAAQVGAYLLAIWGLPSAIVRGVLYHAEPWKEAAMGLTTGGIAYLSDCLLREDDLSEDERDRFRAFAHSRGAAARLDDWRELAAEIRESEGGRAAA